MTENLMTVPQENLHDFFEYFKGAAGGEPQQSEAVQMLQQSMPDSLLRPRSPWIQKFREKPEPPPPQATSNPLPVDHDSQYDNPSGDGWRECFSSSCAMAARFHLGIEFNEYHQRRPQYGDSTDASAQVRTLQSFGLDAKFVQIGSVEKLKEQIDLGRPTPVGYLHKGTGHGSGGGHYCLCIGYDDTGFFMNDPGGELDCRNGGFISTEQFAGRCVHYSYENWVPRWSVASSADGWGVGIALPKK